MKNWIKQNQDDAFVVLIFIMIGIGVSLMVSVTFRGIRAEEACIKLGYPNAILRGSYYCTKRGPMGEDMIVPSGVK